jgi:F0F1-type ATP synthase assembly protein I
MQNDLNKKKQKLNNFAKYTSIAFQMMITIVLFSLGGFKLDEWLETKFPIFTVILTLIGVFAGIYYAIKDFINFTDKKNKNDNNKTSPK